MLELLLFPFKLAFGIISAVFHFIGGLFSLIFGLLGGLLSLIIGLSVTGIIIALIAVAVHRHREARRVAEDDDFISYYDKDAVK